MLRKFAELINREVVIRRTLPQRVGGGAIFVSPDSALSYWKRDLETTFSSLFDWVEAAVSEGDVVWDIGANVGAFAFAAAGKAGQTGRVLAVEPDVFLVGLLQRTARLELPLRAPVEVLPLATGAEIDVARFCIAERGRSSNHLKSSAGGAETGGVRFESLVPMVTLDWLAQRFPAPNVLKIDVEGAEVDVLRGGLELLKTASPTVVCEVFADHIEAVTQLLKSCGYHFFDADNLADGEISCASYNTLAVRDVSSVHAAQANRRRAA
ncbi:FkbM family methyltransferase [Planctellipticum variicoloris]|uniref:FkbM family methyltransferase n=1 Tax=Planctellipticum variicoloris TaxID=3064265 RepID=UPI00301342A5|nr:FkbM family methyltransferase [Planctomycetaceae bacterium SH412]